TILEGTHHYLLSGQHYTPSRRRIRAAAELPKRKEPAIEYFGRITRHFHLGNRTTGQPPFPASARVGRYRVVAAFIDASCAQLSAPVGGASGSSMGSFRGARPSARVCAVTAL